MNLYEMENLQGGSTKPEGWTWSVEQHALGCLATYIA